MKTYTKGNIIVEDIKIGDIHYEFEMNMGTEVKVISLPVLTKNTWKWKSVKVSNDSKIIDYIVNINYPQYAPNLYDYKAYEVKQWL